MPESGSPIRHFIAQLKRRHVIRVGLVYGAVAVAVIEIADLIFEPLGIPSWAYTLLVVLVLLGLPIALVLAWAFEVTPEGGVRREVADDVAADPGRATAPGAEPAASTGADDVTGADPPARATDAGSARRRARGGRDVVWKRLAIAAPVSIVLVALAFGIWRSSDPLSNDAIVVLPFAVRGDGGLSYLREGMVDLLSRNLDGAEHLRAVDPATVLVRLGAGSGDAITAERGSALAEDLGVGLYMLGSVHHIAGTLRIQAALHERAAGSAPVVQAQVQGDTAQLFELVDELSARILAGRRVGAGRRLARVAAVTTGSLPALKAYLEGERHLRAAEFDSAIAGFQEAVALDSAFGLAHYRLAVTGGWSSNLALAHRAMPKALAHADRLGGRDRRLLEAYEAMMKGEADAAEASYRAILREYPDDIEAEFQLADVLYHYNPARGRPITESWPYFRMALEADPEFLCPL